MVACTILSPGTLPRCTWQKGCSWSGILGYLGDGDFILKKIKRRLTEVEIFAQLRI